MNDVVVVEESEKFEKAKGRQELKKFWTDILPLLQLDSKLHDIARLTYKVKSSIIPEGLQENEKRVRVINNNNNNRKLVWCPNHRKPEVGGHGHIIKN